MDVIFRPSDIALNAVTSNNIVTINKVCFCIFLLSKCTSQYLTCWSLLLSPLHTCECIELSNIVITVTILSSCVGPKCVWLKEEDQGSHSWWSAAQTHHTPTAADLPQPLSALHVHGSEWAVSSHRTKPAEVPPGQWEAQSDQGPPSTVGDKQTAKAIECLQVSPWSHSLSLEFNFCGQSFTCCECYRFIILIIIYVYQAELSGKEPKSLDMKLTVAQMHLSQGSVYKACDGLRDLGEYTYRPGVVSSIYTYIYTALCL